MREGKKKAGLKGLLIGVSAVSGLALGALYWWSTREKPPLPKSYLARALAEPLHANAFPLVIRLQIPDEPQPLEGFVRYSLDLDLQSQMEKLISSYKPDYAAFVALDAETGQILSLVSYSYKPNDLGNLALKAIFPAASVFKLVTATAAVDTNHAKPDTVIAFNGANHTLYRRNVTQTAINRWTRYMTLREAFAKSVNSVFGKVGLMLKPDEIEEYARRFKFNEEIGADVPVEKGSLSIDAADEWSLVELASGFNRISLMSPLQGALMAAAVANQGRMMEPYLIESFLSKDGEVAYEVKPKVTSVTMTPETAFQIQKLMRATVTSGTSTKSFRDFLRNRKYANIEVGGKTGSLTGDLPKGKVDWFVGYAQGQQRKIALAALTINEVNWKVKSAYLGKKFIEMYYHPSRRDTSSIRQISQTHSE